MRGLVITFLIGSSALLAACSKQAADTSNAETAAMPVQVAVAQAQNIAEIVTVPGTVTREQHARLASPYGGLVTQTPVTAGSTVHRGELLLAVGASDARARLAAAEANAVSRRAEAQQAAADVIRFKALRSEGAVAPREYEQVQQRDTAARAQAQAAAQALSAARNDLHYAEVRAPFDGLLVERPVKTGDYVAPGTLVAVVVGGAAQVELQVGDAVYPHLPLNAEINLTIDAQTYSSRVLERVDAVDPVTRSHRVKLQLEGEAMPDFGVYAIAQVPTGTRLAVLVPADAVVTRAGLQGVFVIDANGRAQFQPVLSAKADQAGMVAIASGLQAGERVVRAPPLTLGNGTQVRVATDASHD